MRGECGTEKGGAQALRSPPSLLSSVTWARCLTSLGLNFLILKIRMMVNSVHIQSLRKG